MLPLNTFVQKDINMKVEILVGIAKYKTPGTEHLQCVLVRLNLCYLNPVEMIKIIQGHGDAVFTVN